MGILVFCCALEMNYICGYVIRECIKISDLLCFCIKMQCFCLEMAKCSCCLKEGVVQFKCSDKID